MWIPYPWGHFFQYSEWGVIWTEHPQNWPPKNPGFFHSNFDPLRVPPQKICLLPNFTAAPPPTPWRRERTNICPQSGDRGPPKFCQLSFLGFNYTKSKNVTLRLYGPWDAQGDACALFKNWLVKIFSFPRYWTKTNPHFLARFGTRRPLWRRLADTFINLAPRRQCHAIARAKPVNVCPRHFFVRGHGLAARAQKVSFWPVFAWINQVPSSVHYIALYVRWHVIRLSSNLYWCNVHRMLRYQCQVGKLGGPQIWGQRGCRPPPKKISPKYIFSNRWSKKRIRTPKHFFPGGTPRVDPPPKKKFFFENLFSHKKCFSGVRCEFWPKNFWGALGTSLQKFLPCTISTSFFRRFWRRVSAYKTPFTV